jgi:hypothetical protein
MTAQDKSWRTRRSLFVAVALSAILCLALQFVGTAHASPIWGSARGFTAASKDAAVALARAALDGAIAQAQSAEEAYRGVAAAIDAAELEGAAATEELLAALTAAAEASAVAAGEVVLAEGELDFALGAAATAGTILSVYQLGSWGFDACWDPCSTHALHLGVQPVYQPATLDETLSLIPAVVFAATGFTITNDDFAAAGERGSVAQDFLERGIRMFIDEMRGAAAATAHLWDQVLEAVGDLQQQLVGVREAMVNFADVLAATVFNSPLPDLLSARTTFDAAVSQARGVCDAAAGDNCSVVNAALDSATNLFQSAQNHIEAIQLDGVVGTANSAFADFTLADFETFLADTAAAGSAALPRGEIDTVDLLLNAAGVSLSDTTAASSIAQYDALGDVGGRESALFDPITGTINIAELLRGSATTLSTSGSWLNIDLEASPLTREARANVSEPPPLLLFVGLLIFAFCWRSVRQRTGRSGERRAACNVGMPSDINRESVSLCATARAFGVRGSNLAA